LAVGQVPFQIVGMQFHQTGGQIIATQIDRALGHVRPLGHICDDTVVDGQ
jgi:hypothetical protein